MNFKSRERALIASARQYDDQIKTRGLVVGADRTVFTNEWQRSVC